jgi:6-phosphogluconolactonase (cycloisomerase 2 family)
MAVSPATATIAKGGTEHFVATGIFTDKSRHALASVTWTALPAGIAGISSKGVATGQMAGEATVTATVGSIRATAALTVTPARLVSIAVSPQSATVAAGLTSQFTATGTYSDGTKKPLSDLTWSTSNSYDATSNSQGLVTTFHAGTLMVTAALGTIQGTAKLIVGSPVVTSVSITPAIAYQQSGFSGTQVFTATGVFSDHSTADLTSEVKWAGSNPYVAGISASGSIATYRAGFSQVTATLENVTGRAGLAVLAAPRFLYESTDSGRDVARLAVNASTGQPRQWGYQSTDETDGVSLGCVATDPSNKNVYVINVVPGFGQTPYVTAVSAYEADPLSGTLTSMGAPYFLSEPIGCLQFHPSGKFAFAASEVSESSSQLVTVARSSSGVLSIANTTPLTDYASGLAIDPNGRILYVGTQQLVANAQAFAYGFSIDASDGALTPIPGTPLQLPTNTGAIFSFHPSGDYLYLSDSNGESISEYVVDQKSGALTAGSSSVSPCINPGPLSFTPDARFAFVGCGQGLNRDPANKNLVSLGVQPSGGLSFVATSTGYLSPTSLTVDPSGSYLYVISSGSHFIKNGPGSYTGGYNSVVTYSIQPDGTTTEVSETDGRAGESNMVLISGSSSLTFNTPWVFITDTAPGNPMDPEAYQLKSYMLETNGSFQGRESISTIQFPFSLTSLPWSSQLLLAGQQPKPNVQAFTFDNSTTLLDPGSTFGAGSTVGDLVMDPSGEIAFGSDPSTGLVYWYGYKNAPGQWANLSSAGAPASFTAEAGAGPLALDPAGRYLFVANTKANSISEFQYAGAAPVNPFPLPASPLAIAVDPTGSLLFVAGSDNRLRMFMIDVDGKLHQKADLPLAGTPAAIAIEPGAHHVYVADGGGLDSFNMDAEKDTLTPLSQKLTVNLVPSVGVYADPAGKYLFVVATDETYQIGSKGIFGFTINPDGTLTAVSTMTLAVLDNASSVSFLTTAQ